MKIHMPIDRSRRVMTKYVVFKFRTKFEIIQKKFKKPPKTRHVLQ